MSRIEGASHSLARDGVPPAVDKEILIASLMPPAGHTGIHTHVTAFREFLRRNDQPCEVLTPFGTSRLIVYPLFGLRKLITPFSGSLSVWWYRRWHRWSLARVLRKRLRCGRPCVVYAQCPVAAQAALEARVDESQRVVMIVHFNVSQANEWAWQGMIRPHGRYYQAIQRFEQRILAAVDGIVFVSQFVRDQIRARMPSLDEVPNIVLPNFIPDRQCHRSVEKVADLITVGTVESRKNYIYLLEVLAAAHAMGYRYTLSIVGDGPDLKAVRAHAKALRLGDAVSFWGALPNARDLMPQHRAYVHAAKMENCCFVLIEAMSHGLPVFAPAAGGMTEAFQDGVQGIHIPLDDAESAAQALTEVLEDDAVYNRLSKAARRRYLEKFETNRVAGDLLAFVLDC